MSPAAGQLPGVVQRALSTAYKVLPVFFVARISFWSPQPAINVILIGVFVNSLSGAVGACWRKFSHVIILKRVIMSCYLRHIAGFLNEAGIHITGENRQQVDRAIHQIAGLATKIAPLPGRKSSQR